MSINKVILVGNVGNDPEVKYVREDLPVARFRLATNETYKTRDGERKTETEWHNVVVWRGLAKVVEQYVKKGTLLYLEGKITNRQYEKDGQIKYFTEIVVREMKMLSRASDSSNSNYSQPNSSKQEEVPPKTDVPEVSDFEDIDDLPF